MYKTYKPKKHNKNKEQEHHGHPPHAHEKPKNDSVKPHAPKKGAQAQRRRPRRDDVRYAKSTLNGIKKRTETPAKPEKEKKNTLKVMVLGGCEEVGRNMTVFEYENDILIVDMGLQFPEEDMPGIDYIIPDISYLKGKEHKIRGVFITHGHFDHIGAVSHLIPELGYPTIYTAPLTAGLIKRKHEEYRDVQPLKIQVVKTGEKIKLGKSFEVKTFHINHTIPDSFWVILDTPVGRVIHTGDFKFDDDPILEPPVELAEVKKIAKENKIRLFMCDSTNANRPGHQLSEGAVAREIDGILANLKGRVIVGTFASNLIRIQSLITIAEKYGRKVVLKGRSIHTYVEVAHELGLMKYKKGTIVEWNETKRLSPDKLLIICTGAQGERNAVLMRIAMNEDREIRLMKGDTVLFSSSVIPGNERTIQNLQDALCRAGAKVINYQMMDIHAGGHMRREDLRDLINLVRPEYWMPIEANHHILKEHAEIALEEGYPENKVIVADNGQVVEVTKQKVVLTKKKVPTEYIFVDGLGVGDVSEIVLRDRRLMAADGMLVVIATIEKKTGKLVQNPDLISRGFIYMKENKGLVEQTRNKVKKILAEKEKKTPAFEDYIKTKIRNELGDFLYKKTKRRPMILPVLIEV